MSSVPNREGVKAFLVNLALVLLGSLLFAAAFPNLLFKNGLPLVAWVAYAPVFFVIQRSGFKASVFWGALYGYSAYGLFNYWLSVFHPLAGLIVGSIYLVYLALLFPLLKLAVFLFPRRGYILQWFIWMSFEYLRTQGFLGYSYGITGYSQWNLVPVIQVASLTGVWGVSALVVFSSAWIAAALADGLLPADGVLPAGIKGLPQRASLSIKTFFKKEWVSALLWALALAAALIYGFASQIDYSAASRAKLALIQHNTDPWKGGIPQYWENYRVLKRLSDEAIRDNPDLDVVVWSETAFVPRIYWHTVVRDDPASWDMVKELLAYLSSQKVPFVIGNDDARKEPAKNPLGDNRVDYNAVILFEEGKIKTLYRKLHLVPFTEHFPYQKQFPWVYNLLIQADTHFWEKGREAVVFEHRGLKFSTPVCFEDTFGYLSRDFVRNGAELIVNLSNDAWSKSLPAQMQHLSMAVFRAVENRRSMARSTASGQTCAIDPNGRILAMAEPFTEAALTVELPVIATLSFYTRCGDWLPVFFIAGALSLLIGGIIRRIMRVEKKGSLL